MSETQTTRARYFDGDHPVPHEVSCVVSGKVLEMSLNDGQVVQWPLDQIRRVRDDASRSSGVLRWTKESVARLFFTDPRLLTRMPRLYRAAPTKGRGRLAAWALAAVCAVAVQIGILIPILADNLAEFIPPEGERALGEATFGHIREALDETGLNPIEVCENPAGMAALDRLVARLTGKEAGQQQLQVAVLDHRMINAFALPGGYVVLFRGLIQAADGPDEVAAVLGHEIGHVVSRDPTRHALRSAGSIGVLGLLFGDFAGGAAVLILAERLISASYSQEVEAGADEYAHDLLARADINPGALGDMFDNMRRIHGDNDGLVAHFLSHPALGERIEAAKAAMEEGAEYRPSMSDVDWRSLQKICR